MLCQSHNVAPISLVKRCLNNHFWITHYHGNKDALRLYEAYVSAEKTTEVRSALNYEGIMGYRYKLKGFVSWSIRGHYCSGQKSQKSFCPQSMYQFGILGSYYRHIAYMQTRETVKHLEIFDKGNKNRSNWTDQSVSAEGNICAYKARILLLWKDISSK